MGIFSGANDSTPAAAGNGNNEDRPFFSDGDRRVRIDKSILRISSNEGSKNFGQAMVITEFTVLDNYSGEELRTAKAIEILSKAPTGVWLKKGKHALSRVQSMVAAALGGQEVGEDVLTALWPTADLESGKAKFVECGALQGVEVRAITSSFPIGDGFMTTTRYESLD